jgi:hypothetical protein
MLARKRKVRAKNAREKARKQAFIRALAGEPNPLPHDIRLRVPEHMRRLYLYWTAGEQKYADCIDSVEKFKAVAYRLAKWLGVKRKRLLRTMRNDVQPNYLADDEERKLHNEIKEILDASKR